MYPYANYTNLHEPVNANLNLTEGYPHLHTQKMDCIDWINDKLENKAVTQAALRQAIEDAGLGKTTQPTISRILKRTTPNPGYKTVNALIKACGGDPDGWMSDGKKKPEENGPRTSIGDYSSAELSAELARRLSEPERMRVNEKNQKR